jgi:signal transduction histidine kinase
MAAIASDRHEALLQQLLTAMREPVLLTDRVGKVVCASGSARKLLGSPRRLDGKLLVRFVGPEERRRFRALLQEPDRPDLELMIVPEGGNPFPALVQAADAGDWIFWSLEELDRGYPELQPAFDRLVDGLTDGVVVVDRGLHVVLANRSSRRTGGFEIGQRLPERWGDFDLQAFASALFNPAARHAEAVVRPTDRDFFTLTGMPTLERRRALLLITDVGDRARRERQEREFITNAAHELQTPLTAIVGAVEVLEAGAADDPVDRQRFLSHLRRESERLVRLVRSLLVLARATSPEGLHSEEVNVRRLLDDIAGDLRPRDGVRVVVLAPPGLVVVTDRELVERALVNLAENAVKHTRAGRILLSGRSSRRGIVLEVWDSGGGMAEDERERATDRFYRGGDRDAAGFGLGLSIVRQVADALGGAFELESAPGEGTVARLVFSRAAS